MAWLRRWAGTAGRRRSAAALALVLGLAAATAGCAAPLDGGALAPVPLPVAPPEPAAPAVGVLLPLSGPLAPEGRAAETAARLALADLPEGDRPRLDVADTRGDARAAVRAAEGLVLDGDALGLVALADSTTAEALAVLAERLRVPLVLLGTGSDVPLDGRAYVFRVGPSDAVLARTAAQAAAGLGPGPVATLADATEPRSTRAAAAFRAAAADLHLGVAARIAAYGPDDGAALEALSALSGRGVRAVFVAGPPEAWLPLLDLVRRAGVPAARVVTVDGVLPAPTLGRLEEAAREAPLAAAVPYHPDAGEATTAFRTAFRAAAGADASAAAALAYDAMRLVAAALGRVHAAGDVAETRAALREALQGVPPQPGATGRVGFAGGREASRRAHAVRLEPGPAGGLRWERLVPQEGDSGP